MPLPSKYDLAINPKGRLFLEFITLEPPYTDHPARCETEMILDCEVPTYKYRSQYGTYYQVFKVSVKDV